MFAHDLDVNTVTQLDKASGSGLQVLSSNYVWVLTFTFASDNISSFRIKVNIGFVIH